MRNQAALAACVLGRARPSCRFSKPALPLASITHRAVHSRGPPGVVSEIRWIASPSVIARTRESSSTVVPDSAIVRRSMFSRRPRSSWNDGTGGKVAVAELDPRRDVGIAVVREEVAKPQFLELRAAQVRLEPEDLLKVVGADLDARFADLEGGLAHRMLALLDHQHAQRRRFQMQLPGERAASQAAADDHGVVMSVHHR